jgi:hypothetical protein
VATLEFVQEEKIKEIEISAVHVLDQVYNVFRRKDRSVKVHSQEATARLWSIRAVKRPKSLKSFAKT